MAEESRRADVPSGPDGRSGADGHDEVKMRAGGVPGADGPAEVDRPTGALDVDAYQRGALRTALFPDIGGERCLYPALGLANEAGEVLGKLKKLYRDRGGEVTPGFREGMKRELGDVLWYVAVLADAFDLELSEVGRANLEKLADRARRGALHGSGDER